MNTTTAECSTTASLGVLTVESVTLNLVFLSTLAVTIATNSLTIIVFIETPALRTITNIFLVSLSLSDQLYALFLFGLWTTSIIFFFHSFYVSFDDLQRYFYFACGILIHSSNGNLILVSLERWLYIARPFWYQRLVSLKTVVISLTFMWVSALVVNVPYLPEQSFHRRVLYFVILHSFVYPGLHTFCCLCLVLVYSHISLITFRQLKKISKIQPSSQQSNPGEARAATASKGSLHARNWKSVRLLITLCGLFFLCVSPYVYLTSYACLHPGKWDDMATWNMPLLILLSVYHCSNFFVYILSMSRFRSAFKKKTLKCACCRRNRVDNVGQTRATSAHEHQSRTSVHELQTRTSVH